MKGNYVMKPVTSRILSLWFLIPVYCGIMFSCSQSEFDSIDLDNNAPVGNPVEISISLDDIPGYSDSGMNGSDTPSTRGDASLINEWVKPEHFSVTRSAEDYEGPAIAAMELFETPGNADVSGANTRSVMASGVYFRLIVFRKSGTNYVFQSVADYTSNGASAPTLSKGKILVPMGATCRFVAYSFNNSLSLGKLPSTYTWNSSSIPIPNLNDDFMTFDSGDKEITDPDYYSLNISFTHQLCRLTIKPSLSGFSTNYYSCSNASVKQGGNSSSWTIGSPSIVADTNNTANFSIENTTTGSATIRIVPFASERPISVYFGTLTVGGKQANGTTITSSQSVKLSPGRSYTMTVQFKKSIGINVPFGDINLTSNGCTASDKTLLSSCTWAEGNLNSTALSNITWAPRTSDYGYYYTWSSLYTGNTQSHNVDPCKYLDASIYGSGWRTPTRGQFEALGRCTDKKVVSGGIWFMNNVSGLFLPLAGYRGNNSGSGSGTTAKDKVGTGGYYWTDEVTSSGAYTLRFSNDGFLEIGLMDKIRGITVRCVKK